MISLKIKILGLTTAILVAAVGVTAWHNVRTQHEMLNRIASQNGRILGETIRNSIITDMANGENTAVGRILEKIKKEPTIDSVRVFDETGRILLSANQDDIGKLVESADLLAFRSGKTSYRIEIDGNVFHNTILPIPNAPTCFECHGKAKEVLGVLNVHLSLSEMEGLQTSGRNATFVSSLGMLTLLIISISGFILFYVDAPLRKLVTAMNHVEKGEFDQAVIMVSSSREMSMLSAKFNLMVDRLRGLVEGTVYRERELAINQEKLAHHEEIRNMNITLAERLKEIEYLNITLEERVEEVEEANFKITDLASELEKKNKDLEQALGKLSGLYKLGLAVNATMDLPQLFGLLINRVVETFNARIGYILLLEKDTWTMKIAASVGLPSSAELPERIVLKKGGISHWVIENREPLLIQSMEDAGDFNRVSTFGFSRGSVICVPLFIKGEPVGTLTLANKNDDSPFTPEDSDRLAAIASQAGVAINNARLYQEQQDSYLKTVQALVSAIEAGNPYFAGHSERVTRFSVALGRHMHLPPATIKKLEQAAILHDIGKIGVDLTPLQKKGSLSPGDLISFRRHPVIGSRILEPIPSLQDVRKIVEQHHERFDGLGYPYQLQQEEISLEARILAIADTFDALTTDRPFRKALTSDAALHEIAQLAGTQFDPQVTGAFLNMCRNGSS